MGRAYSADLRGRVIDAVQAGNSARSAAARFAVGVATAIRWVRRHRETGERTARRQGHPVRSKLDPHEGLRLGLIEETVDITLAEMQERLASARGVRAGIGTLWRFFHRRGVTVKKDRACERAGARRRPRGARGLVRGPAGARPRATDLHRR